MMEMQFHAHLLNSPLTNSFIVWNQEKCRFLRMRPADGRNQTASGLNKKLKPFNASAFCVRVFFSSSGSAKLNCAFSFNYAFNSNRRTISRKIANEKTCIESVCVYLVCFVALRIMSTLYIYSFFTLILLQFFLLGHFNSNGHDTGQTIFSVDF